MKIFILFVLEVLSSAFLFHHTVLCVQNASGDGGARDDYHHAVAVLDDEQGNTTEKRKTSARQRLRHSQLTWTGEQQPWRWAPRRLHDEPLLGERLGSEFFRGVSGGIGQHTGFSLYSGVRNVVSAAWSKVKHTFDRMMYASAFHHFRKWWKLMLTEILKITDETDLGKAANKLKLQFEIVCLECWKTLPFEPAIHLDLVLACGLEKFGAALKKKYRDAFNLNDIMNFVHSSNKLYLEWVWNDLSSERQLQIIELEKESSWKQPLQAVAKEWFKPVKLILDEFGILSTIQSNLLEAWKFGLERFMGSLSLSTDQSRAKFKQLAYSQLIEYFRKIGEKYPKLNFNLIVAEFGKRKLKEMWTFSDNMIDMINKNEAYMKNFRLTTNENQVEIDAAVNLTCSTWWPQISKYLKDKVTSLLDDFDALETIASVWRNATIDAVRHENIKVVKNPTHQQYLLDAVLLKFVDYLEVLEGKVYDDALGEIIKLLETGAKNYSTFIINAPLNKKKTLKRKKENVEEEGSKEEATSVEEEDTSKGKR